MTVYSSIQLSQIEYSRVDADFYHPIYLNELHHWEKLKKTVGVAKLSQLIRTPVRTGRTPSSRTINKDDDLISFVKTDTLREGYIDFTKSADLPVRVLTTSDFIVPNSVIVTIIGATPEIVGRAAIVRDTDPRCVTNQNVAVISTNEKCDPYFLTAYLQTKYGRDQLWRHSRRTEQVNLNCREVERILVPNPSIELQKNIGDLVRNSFNTSDESEFLYSQAQQLLESEIGLDKLRFSKPIGYTTKLSDLEISRRADADFFNPELRFFQLELQKRHQLKTLPSFANVLKFSNPSYATEGTPIITQKHLGKIAPDNYGTDLFAQDWWVKNNPSAVLRRDDLLYYSVGAYLGKTNIWFSNDQAVHASFITMLRCHEEIDAGYLQVLLNSRYGILQSKCYQSGTSQPYIYPKDIRRFLVPDVSQELKREITKLVLDSYEKAEESKRLLEQAKTRVEQLIESAVQG